MGPTINKELVTALHVRRAGSVYTEFRHTQTKDFSAIPASGPRSVTEHAMMQVQQSVFGPVRSTEEIQYNHPKDIGKIYGGEILPAKLITGRGQNGRG